MVSSPLQALNAAAYLDFHCDFVVVALEPVEPVAAAQFKNTLRVLFDPARVVSVPFGTMSVFKKRRWLDSFVPAAGTRTVVLGGYHLAFMRRFAHIHPGAAVVAIDDGSMATSVVEHRYGRAPSPYLSGETAAWWRALAKRLVGADPGHLPAVTFFSIYDLDVDAPDSLVVNDFTAIRERFGNGGDRQPGHLVVGSSAVDTGLVDEATYRRLIEAITAQQDVEFIGYRPHRNESPERAAALAAAFGLKLMPLDLPLELELLVGASTPMVLDCSFSTVLDTVPLLLNPPPVMKVWLPEASELAASSRPSVEKLAANWAAKGLSITRVK